MADVTFRRGTQSEIAAVPIVDGQLLWETTNNIIYMDSGSTRLVMAVGGSNGIRPVEYGGTGCSSAGDVGSTLKLATLAPSTFTIPRGANLNSYTTPGVFACQSAEIAATLGNCPFATGAFALTVRAVADTTTVTQTLEGCCLTSSCLVWHRAYVGGTFGDWVSGGGGASDASALTGTLKTSTLPVVPIEKGGTGATTKADARAAIGIHFSESDPGTYIAGDLYIMPVGVG